MVSAMDANDLGWRYASLALVSLDKAEAELKTPGARLDYLNFEVARAQAKADISIAFSLDRIADLLTTMVRLKETELNGGPTG